jgi:predicted phosphoribosyltransferase
VVVAVPVAPRRTVEEIRALADEVVVLEVPEVFFSIGEFYQDFTQTPDEEVVELLARAARSGAPSGPPCPDGRNASLAPDGERG